MITHFDHILNEEEAEKYILSYSFIDRDIASKNKYHEVEHSFINLYKNIFHKYSAYYVIDRDDANSVDYYQFENSSEFVNAVIKSLREIEFIKICIPAIGIILTGNFDLTVAGFSLKKLDKNNDFYDLVTKNGLYCFS